MGQLTHTGELLFGLEVDGVVHKAFELRLVTVQDNIDAVYEVSGSNTVELSLAILARQLLSLGTLRQRPWQPAGAKREPNEPTWISTDLLRKLNIVDFNLFDQANAELQKKALLGASNSSGGSASEQPLPATASAPSTQPASNSPT